MKRDDLHSALSLNASSVLRLQGKLLLGAIGQLLTREETSHPFAGVRELILKSRRLQ